MIHSSIIHHTLPVLKKSIYSLDQAMRVNFRLGSVDELFRTLRFVTSVTADYGGVRKVFSRAFRQHIIWYWQLEHYVIDRHYVIDTVYGIDIHISRFPCAYTTGLHPILGCRS